MRYSCKCDACSRLVDKVEIVFTGPPMLMNLCTECNEEYDQYLAGEEAYYNALEWEEVVSELISFAAVLADQRPRGPTGETAPGA